MGGMVSSCSERALSPDDSIFDSAGSLPQNSFDNWLDDHYVKNYNIDFKYRYQHNESDFSYNLVPASLENSMKLARIIEHVWLGAYDEVTGSPHFMRTNKPAILNIIGSAAWHPGEGTMTLGTAEGGLKIVLYLGNWVDENNPAQLNQYFFKTMHHEFTHILQQTKPYPRVEFDRISQEDYRPSAWFNRKKIEEYASLGFITAYAGSSAVEDITEVTACYVTMTKEEWDAVYAAAGDEGRAKLDEKVKIMKRYMKNQWDIDMDELRDVVAARMGEVGQMDLILPEWKPLLTDQGPSGTTPQGFMVQQADNLLRMLPAATQEYPGRCYASEADIVRIFGDDQAVSDEEVSQHTHSTR